MLENLLRRRKKKKKLSCTCIKCPIIIDDTELDGIHYASNEGSCLEHEPRPYVAFRCLIAWFWVNHTGAKILNLSKNSHFENLAFHKIHNFKLSFFTKVTFSKSHF